MTKLKDVLDSVCCGENVCGEVILASFKDIVCREECDYAPTYANQNCKACVRETAMLTFEALGMRDFDTTALMSAIGDAILGMIKRGELSENAEVNLDPSLA